MATTSGPTDLGIYSIALPPRLQNVLAVGAIGIFLGMVGLCALPLVAEPVTSEYLGRGGVIVDRSLINTWGLVSTNLGCALSALAVLAGVGMLRFKSWSRPLMLVQASVSVLLGIVGIYFHILVLSTAQSGEGTPSFCTRVFGLAEWGGWAAGTIFGCFALYVLTRPGVKAAFTIEGRPI